MNTLLPMPLKKWNLEVIKSPGHRQQNFLPMQLPPSVTLLPLKLPWLRGPQPCSPPSPHPMDKQRHSRNVSPEGGARTREETLGGPTTTTFLPKSRIHGSSKPVSIPMPPAHDFLMKPPQRVGSALSCTHSLSIMKQAHSPTVFVSL